ncbi:hypothetical protein D3C80_604440 [compost metagenome]
MNAVDGFGRDAVVEGIDDATNGIATVEQGGRAADDFDAFDRYRVHRYCVVIRQRGGIQRADPVAQQANAVAVEPTDDRAAGAGAEPGRGHTGLPVQGFAKAGFLLQGQGVAFQRTAGRCQVRAAQWVGGNDLGL